jgi:hypothetical protein
MADRPRTWFGPVVLLGLGSAGLAAVASAKPWFRAAVDSRLLPGVRDPERSADMPLSLALALVVLAAWGALLVTRGRVRRAVVGLGLASAVGMLACIVVAPFTLPGQVRDNLPGPSGDVSVSPTGWYFATAVVIVIALVALGAAWFRAPSWPTMSSRYDAPTTPSRDADEADLWKALDAGRDPTDPGSASGP